MLKGLYTFSNMLDENVAVNITVFFLAVILYD